VAHFTSYIVQADGSRRPTIFGATNAIADGAETDGADETAVKRALARPADAALLARARAVAGSVTLPSWPGSASAPRVHEGVVASADVWTQHADSIRALHEQFGSLCEEMEAAAIAQICAQFEVPFLAVKDISNNELHALTDLDAPGGSVLVHVEEEVGRRAAAVVAALIRSSAAATV
jgi:nucleoside phosphorylase